jgi:hypothetical protein
VLTVPRTGGPFLLILSASLSSGKLSKNIVTAIA